MARPWRIEFPQAVYHVTARGNNRADIVRDDHDRREFIALLAAAALRFNLKIFAFCLMTNHYHLFLRTPDANLSRAMHWLNATYTIRFNRRRRRHGHVFQGRYKSMLVADTAHWSVLSIYIHLNPVRAGVTPMERLTGYRASSFWYLNRKAERPGFLRVETALEEAGGLPDNRSGWRAYEKYLAWQAETGPARKNKAYASLSRGWALGSKDFKQALLKDHAVATEARAWESQGMWEVRALRWQQQLEDFLSAVPKSAQAVGSKSAPWKVAVAARMRQISDAPNHWLAAKLGMGTGIYVSKHVGLMRRDPKHLAHSFMKSLAKVKGKA